MAASQMMLAVCIVFVIVIGRVTSTSHKFPALIVFGDSIVDCGMNNYIKTISRGNFPPYGRDFEGGKPTGRFSNGRVPSDIVAEELGIKQLIPPYLDPTLRTEDLATGVSFASASSGYDPTTSQTLGVLSLEDQLNFFKDYKEKLRSAIGETKTQLIISQSLYLIVTGSNDIVNTYYTLPFRRIQYDIDSYTDLVATFASTFFQDLHKLGARNMAILNIPAVGCLPSERTLAGGLWRECKEEYNRAAAMFNSKLVSVVKSLNINLEGSTLVYLDIYSALQHLLNNPQRQGFEVVDRGCCGTGLIEASILCNKFDLGTCSNASRYIFWDSFHPTQHAYEVLVHQLLKNSIYNSSMSV